MCSLTEYFSSQISFFKGKTELEKTMSKGNDEKYIAMEEEGTSSETEVNEEIRIRLGIGKKEPERSEEKYSEVSSEVEEKPVELTLMVTSGIVYFLT